MASEESLAVKRLKREYRSMLADPTEGITAVFDESNILVWHFILDGPEGTPYDGGQYHGQLVFPADYPHAAPSIMMLTPSGRFEVGKKICISNTDFHPESWSPSWTAQTMLVGLMSFMAGPPENEMGSMRSTDAAKKKFAKDSWDYNQKDRDFQKYFPELIF